MSCWRWAPGEADPAKAVERKPDKELPSLREARRAARLPRRTPTEDDCPRQVSTFGPKTRLLDGQLSFEEIGDDMSTIEENTETVEPASGELELYEPRVPSTLFQTSDPELALQRMATMARLLVGVVRERQLVKRIGDSEYLLAPAWAVLAGMTGLSPFTAWTRKLEDGNGYMARVEVRRVADGATISAAEQLCTRAESKWARADDHALLGMAQTRASSRALRGPLMQV